MAGNGSGVVHRGPIGAGSIGESAIGKGPIGAGPIDWGLVDSGRGNEPPLQPEAVGGPEADVGGAGEDRGGRGDRAGRWEVEQPALEHPQQAKWGQQHGRHDQQDDPGAHARAVP